MKMNLSNYFDGAFDMGNYGASKYPGKFRTNEFKSRIYSTLGSGLSESGRSRFFSDCSWSARRLRIILLANTIFSFKANCIPRIRARATTSGIVLLSLGRSWPRARASISPSSNMTLSLRESSDLKVLMSLRE